VKDIETEFLVLRSQMEFGNEGKRYRKVERIERSGEVNGVIFKHNLNGGIRETKIRNCSEGADRKQDLRDPRS